MSVDSDAMRQKEMDFYTGGRVIMNYGLLWWTSFFQTSMEDWSGVDYLCIIVRFVSADWTLILTAPIHCRGIHRWASDVMLNYSKFVQMKKQTHLIFIYGWTIPFVYTVGVLMYIINTARY